MKLQRLRRGALEWTLALLLVNNYIAVPVAGTLSGVRMFSEKRLTKVVIPTSAVETYHHLPDDLTARDYLNLANGLAWHYGKSDRFYCKEMVEATFRTYKEMTSANGRHDLSDDIRVAADMLNPEPHIWLEVRDKDGWREYDTMNATERLSVREIRSYSDKTVEKKAEFEDPVEAQWYSIPGTMTLLPTAKPFFYKGGYLAFNKHAREAANDAMEKRYPTAMGR